MMKIHQEHNLINLISKYLVKKHYHIIIQLVVYIICDIIYY